MLPLFRLTQNETRFVLDERYEKFFIELKERLTTTPIFVIPDPSKPYEVFFDASEKGLGGVLMQNEQVMAYISQ